jgi:hypothetical protein
MPSKKRKVRISDRMQRFLDGEILVEDLTWEELTKGRLMSDAGDFRGRPTDVIPRKFYDAAQQELMRRWELKLSEELEPALATLKEIINNKKAPADARYKSAVYLIERKVGKVPEKNEVKVQVAPWEAAVEGILLDTEGEARE